MKRTGCMSDSRWFLAFWILYLLSMPMSALAVVQSPSPPASTTDSLTPTPVSPTPPVSTKNETTIDNTTPFGLITLFQGQARRGNYDDASDYLDFGLHLIAPQLRRELTRKFIAVLDMRINFDLKTISRMPQGDRDDGLRPNLDRVGYIEEDGEVIPILLERLFENSAFTWKFSRKTVDKVVALYDINPYANILEKLPQPFIEWRFLGVDMWQWCALLLIVIAGWGITWLFLPLIRRIGDRLITPRGGNGRKDYVVKVWDAVILNSRLFFMIVIVYAASRSLLLPMRVDSFLDRLVSGLLVIILTNMAFAVINASSDWIRNRPGLDENRAILSMLPLVRRIVKILVTIMAILYLLQDFGVNVSAVIAGLGIGGLAVALAAQKTIENLFGGIMLILDKPVRVGDFCRFGTTVGTVEDVGMRSTRIRTLERSRISIPNADFAQMQIENLGERDRIWFHPLLALRLDTSPDQMRYIIVEVKKILVSHPKVDPDPARVRFVKIDVYALQVEIFAYVLTTDWDDYLEIQEDLMFRIMDVIMRSGSALACPTQTLSLEQTSARPTEAKAAAEATVESWRQSNQLYIPRFPSQLAAKLRNTIKYPG